MDRKRNATRAEGALSFAGRRVDYGYLPAAHTDGDLFVQFADLNVMAVGGVALTHHRLPSLYRHWLHPTRHRLQTGGWQAGEDGEPQQADALAAYEAGRPAWKPRVTR